MNPRSLPTSRPGLALLAALSFFLSACSTAPPSKGCSPDFAPEMLIGTWSARIDGDTGSWSLALAPHPEHLGSLRGELRHAQLRYPVVADLDAGEFTMEESHDGRRIAATWQGQLSAPDCHSVIQGLRATGDASPRPFRLTRQP